MEYQMKLIVGLGNPTPQYDKTRHNVGFAVIDHLMNEYGGGGGTGEDKGVYGKGRIAGESVILLKPMTFMNLSGESISQVANYYKIQPEDIIVIYDDINLDVGRLRIRKKGSAGGHNGIKNMIQHLNTEDFPRIRVGVGMKPAHMDLAKYVLSHFSKEELPLMQDGYRHACEAAVMMLHGDLEQAMNSYNGK